MSSEQTPKSDSTAGIVPRPNPKEKWRVVSVEACSDYRLHVVFRDGTKGEVRMKRLLENPGLRGTVFHALRDPEFFARADIEMGAVTWPNGTDLAPDAMYEEIRARGYWDVEPD